MHGSIAKVAILMCQSVDNFYVVKIYKITILKLLFEILIEIFWNTKLSIIKSLVYIGQDLVQAFKIDLKQRNVLSGLKIFNKCY